MNFEALVGKMMAMNNLGRLWHWGTVSAQHHDTFEKFLTANEQFTDSFVESVLGNDLGFDVGKVAIEASLKDAYSLELARQQIKDYRQIIRDTQQELSREEQGFQAELSAILDDINELCSKSLYLLKLQ